MSLKTIGLFDGQEWTVPLGVSSIELYSAGAAGGAGGVHDGRGAWVRGTLAVTSGQVVKSIIASGSYPDGKGGRNSGGGSTILLVDGVAIAIGAGGGGGSKYTFNVGGENFTSFTNGGDGGYPSGTAGGAHYGSGGSPGTQTSDGQDHSPAGGGGGGGYHTGGTGSSDDGGGGGSSYIDPSLTATSNGANANRNVQGSASVTYDPATVPLIATIITPKAGAYVPAGNTDLTWKYNAPDTQLKADVEYRKPGDTATAATVNGATSSYTIVTTEGDYEWRVRTYSQYGIAGEWTAWTAFRAETVLDLPAITVPVAQAIIPDTNLPIEWNANGQEAWQAQILNGTEVLWDSGQQSGADNSTIGEYNINNAQLTVRVRIRGSNLWTDWVSVTVYSSWSAPAAPLVRARSDNPDGSSIATWTQPDSDVDVDVYRLSVIENGIERTMARNLPADTTEFTYWTPPSCVDVTIRVYAYASNGVYSYSDGG